MRSGVLIRDPVTGRILPSTGVPRSQPSGDSGTLAVDPVAAARDAGPPAEPAGGIPKRGRGRPPGPAAAAAGGTKTAGAPQGASLDLSSTIACLKGAHAIASHFGGPCWLLNDADAKLYAQAIADVARHYDVGVAQKTMDIGNLIGMICFIEGTRFAEMRRLKNAPPPPQGPAGGFHPIFTFSPPATAPQPQPPGAPGTTPPAAPLPEGEATPFAH